MSLVLVLGRPRPRPGAVTGSSLTWGAVGDELDRVRADAAGVLSRARIADLTGLADASGETSIAYPDTPDAVGSAVEHAIDRGAEQVVVLQVAVAVDTGEPDPTDTDQLEARIDEVCRAHPDVDIIYVGPPYDDPPALEHALALLRAPDSEEPALLAGAVQRAFAGDTGLFGRFMSTLQEAVPRGTRIALRGSAVQGSSYKTGEPFDGRGAGTSDLDLVLIGEDAMAEWRPEAFYLPGVNTMPLWDDARWVAPRLDESRTDLQSMVGRPVSLQAMARWFLDLRSGLQGTPYVMLDG